MTPPAPLARRALLAAPFVASGATAQPGITTATPRQTAGPFYPLDWSGDIDGDLVRVTGAAAQAIGIVTHLRGQVRDAAGRPVPGAMVEIWQCDAQGRYLHPRDRQDGRDAGFQGRGRVIAAADGSYAFRTIRPVPYPGRTPHIHVAVARPGAPPALITQFYLAGEPLNERDGLFLGLRDPAQRAALLLRLERADGLEAGALQAVRDIVIG